MFIYSIWFRYIYIYNYMMWFMANVYDMNHILMPSLGSFPRAWRKDIDTSRPQDFATGLQSHRMSQRCINIINIINFKLFERAMMCYVPVPWMYLFCDAWNVFQPRHARGVGHLSSLWRRSNAAWLCHASQCLTCMRFEPPEGGHAIARATDIT